MKSLIVLCCFMAVALAVRDPEWESFKTKFTRKYKNPTEEAFRKKIFLNNKLAIDQQNQRFAEGKSTFTMAVNQFADLTTQEFSETMNNYVMRPSQPAHEKDFSVSQSVNAATVDWRDSGCVTGVKDQGQCGSCWSFSAIASTEYTNCVSSGKLVSLSEQNVVDCSWSYGNLGCNGGQMDAAFQYIIANKGVDTESSYPYTAVSLVNNCQYSVANKGGSLIAYTDVTPHGNEASLETASNLNPVSVAIDASHASFQLYSSGVYDEPLCSTTQLDHGVTVIGYGTDAGTAYWLVKNSWGVTWGIAGYIEMSKDKNNQCGIATEASYAQA